MILNMKAFWLYQGSEYTYHESVYASGTEYTKALNITGLQRVLNMPVNMSAYTYMYEYARICMNMSTSAWMIFAF